MDGHNTKVNKSNDFHGKGQSNKIEKLNNPYPASGVKASRNTGENKSGSAYLRRNQHGK